VNSDSRDKGQPTALDDLRVVELPALDAMPYFAGAIAGKAFAELGDFFGARAAAANFGATAGCGHEVLLGDGSNELAKHESRDAAGAVDSR